MQEGLHVGRVIDEQKDSFGRGDFLISNVMGADPEAGDITIGATAEVGSTVQFQVRDADSADEDLRHLLAGQQGRAALVFTCNGRGRNLFDEPDHDARLVHEQVGHGRGGGDVLCRRAGSRRRSKLRARLHGVGRPVQRLSGRDRAVPDHSPLGSAKESVSGAGVLGKVATAQLGRLV